MATISVIIPAFNGATRYLDRAIESALSQSVRDIELIVVDDASTDDTERIVRAVSRARYVRRPSNTGQAAARNDGARLAAAPFVAFLDQDDLWEPTFLEETLARAEADPDVAVVHTDGYQVNERNEILEYDGAMKQAASITQLFRGAHDVATSGSLFRKRCFDTVGGYDASLAVWEDIDLAIRLYRRFRIVHLPKPLYRHRLYARNVSRDIPSARSLEGRRKFLEKHGPSCAPGSPEFRALSLDWAQYYGDLGKHHLRDGDARAARHAFREALRHHSLSLKAMLRLIRSYLAPQRPRASSPHRP